MEGSGSGAGSVQIITDPYLGGPKFLRPEHWSQFMVPLYYLTSSVPVSV